MKKNEMNNFFDIKKARKETRGCENIIHFNNAGASLMPIPVSDVLHDYLNREEYIGGYETAAERFGLLENLYSSCSKLLGCKENEIAFAENATRAWDMAFYSLKFHHGERILTSYTEYGSNMIAFLQRAREHDLSIEFIPTDEAGEIDTDALENMLDEHVRLISVSHIPTGSGLVQPVKDIGRIANSAGITFLLDACQSVGHVPLDVNEIGCDILSGTGRKYLRGPRGTGFLYVRESTQERLTPIFLDIHAADLISPSDYRIRKDAKRFESWEQNFAGKAALGKAIDYALSWNLEKIRDRVYLLANLLRRKLSQIEGVIVTDEGKEPCGIVTFMTKQLSHGHIKSLLTAEKINVSVSEGSGNFISFAHRGIKGVVRVSLHYFNTEEEVAFFTETLSKILRKKW